MFFSSLWIHKHQVPIRSFVSLAFAECPWPILALLASHYIVTFQLQSLLPITQFFLCFLFPVPSRDLIPWAPILEPGQTTQDWPAFRLAAIGSAQGGTLRSSQVGPVHRNRRWAHFSQKAGMGSLILPLCTIRFLGVLEKCYNISLAVHCKDIVETYSLYDPVLFFVKTLGLNLILL